MEASQPLAIESFSYSWLSNLNPSLDGLDDPHRPSTLVSSHDSHILNSKTFQDEYNSSPDFDFDISSSQSPEPLVHADELFSNGCIKPVFNNRPRALKSSNSSDSIPVLVMTDPAGHSSSPVPVTQIYCRFLGRWRRSSEQFLQKFVRFFRFRHGRHRLGGSRKSPRVDDIDRRVSEVNSWNNSPDASPQRSTSFSAGDWADLATETSINEAVLHCKRSISK